MTARPQKFWDCLLLVIVFMIIIYTCILSINTSITQVNVSTNIPYVRNQVASICVGCERQYDLRVVVITYNRAKSLLRLLNSLHEANYDSDSVKLEVWIDRSQTGEVDNLTLDIAKNFSFRHGLYEIKVRGKHAGIYGQWMTSWTPQIDSSEIAVILEDDLTLSPHFYRYLKVVHKRYDSAPNINGYALQGYSIKHHVNDNSVLEGPEDSLVYLYPVIGTWGFSPVTKKWTRFLRWFYSSHVQSYVNPFVPNNIASYWYIMFQRQGKDDSMWEMWHIYYSWIRKEYTLYSNFPGKT